MTNFDTPQIEKWKEYHKEIERLIKSGDIKNFLNWYPIRRAVFVGNAKHIRHKLNWLKEHINPARLRRLLQDNWIGNPKSLQMYPRTTGTRVNMLYHMTQIWKRVTIALADLDYIFEFGGGYGCLAEMVIRDGFKGGYTIYDLPVMNQIQDYYLGRVGVLDQVEMISSLKNVVIPDSISAFVATMSFSEIPLESRIPIEKFLKEFDFLVFVYAESFHQIDNVRYFERLQENLSLDGAGYDWVQWPVDHDLPVVRPGKNYLVGVKK